MNTIDLSNDRMILVIHYPNGVRTELRSARPQGFTDEDIAKARELEQWPHLDPGEWRHMRKYEVFGRWPVYLYVTVGPPTWWLPKMQIKRDRVMVGWLRGLVGVAVGEVKTVAAAKKDFEADEDHRGV